MTDSKLKEMVKMLTIRTAESKIRWTRSEPESKYRINFSNGSVTINNWINKGKEFVDLSIYNKDGQKLEDFKFNNQTEFQWYDLVVKLYATIQKKNLESDVTADRIIGELK